MYRPFVTCDDPKGVVVECGTVRKSKHNKMGSSSHRSLINKGSTAGPNNKNPSSFQLMEVSKGARKLNKVIDSWGKEKEDAVSKENMAKDLLKGALDLKDSLVMLGKLQEASKYMAKLKQKQKQQKEKTKEKGNFERVKIVDELPSVRRVISSDSGYQKPRLSVDGGDYIDELRMAITDSFDRQNLLSVDERASLYRRRREESATTQSNGASNAEKKEKISSSASSSNLIAKLMGLEYIPPESSPRMHAQKRMDIDMPKVRKLQLKEDSFLKVKEDEAQQRSLKELLGTMEFRGLLKNNSSPVGELSTHHQSNQQQHHHQLLPGGIPPVVLIKPFHLLESEMGCHEEEEVMSSNASLRKVRLKDENFNPERSNQGGQRSSKRIGEEEEQVKRVVQREGHVNGKNNRMPRKLGTEESGRKLASRENGASKEQKEVVPRTNKEGIKNKVTVDKKVDKIHKRVGSVGASEGKETVKVRDGSRVEDKSKVLKSRRMRSSETVQKPSATHDAKVRNKSQEEGELVDEVKEATLDTADLPEDKEVDLIGAFQPVVQGSSSILEAPEQICREEETDSSAFPLEGQCTESHISPANVPPHTPEFEKSSLPVEDQKIMATSAADEEDIYNGRTKFKTFLLSSRDFLIRAEQLFPITTASSSPNALPTSTKYDSDASLDTKLSLDYANELMDCRSRTMPYSNARRAHNHSCIPPSCTLLNVTLDQLVEEVCNGVDALKGYSKLNSVSGILERDVMSQAGTVSQVWEVGWRNGLCMEEGEEAVIELEKLIIDQLIEEIFI